ncbi:MAG: type II toxin-antitoxin system RelE/ParE family toxin [Leptospiraceae bacterium]|nr:type II toxin-antitoxin system RelE/ParE family toxin [Leptospiraceae bacterium]MCP5496453.1 type II toxin-antitoxin system RelE/ParE family toxin [Leptospiraceae bacterium]
MEIIWTEYALDSLKDIFDYIKKDSIQSAKKFASEILNFSETFSSFPYKYPVCQELESESIYYRSAVYKSRYRIIYKIAQDTIYILDVFHTSRNPTDIIKLKEFDI